MIEPEDPYSSPFFGDPEPKMPEPWYLPNVLGSFPNRFDLCEHRWTPWQAHSDGGMVVSSCHRCGTKKFLPIGRVIEVMEAQLANMKMPRQPLTWAARYLIGLIFLVLLGLLLLA